MARAGVRPLARALQGGTVLNGIVTHQDWLPTLLAAAGKPDIKEKLLEGHRLGDKTYKVHLDGCNMLPYLTGEVKESPRKYFFYISDDGEVMALRMGDWKIVVHGAARQALARWEEPFVQAARRRRCSTCVAIPSSAPRRTRTRTTTG